MYLVSTTAVTMNLCGFGFRVHAHFVRLNTKSNYSTFNLLSNDNSSSLTTKGEVSSLEPDLLHDSSHNL